MSTARQPTRDTGWYERTLASEGLAPIESLFHCRGIERHPVRFTRLDRHPVAIEAASARMHGIASVVELPEAQVWRDFDAAIHGLVGWEREALELLMVYSETGRLEEARRRAGLTRRRARTVLATFTRQHGFRLVHGILRKAAA